MAYAKTNLSASTAAVTNRFVTSTNMKVGAYTLANTTAVHGAGFKVTVTHATVATGTDTLGTIVIVGKNLSGQTVTETLTPVADSTATGTQIFKSLTSATGAGWVIAGGNDTLTIGQALDAYVVDGSGELYAVVVNTAQATSIALADASGTFATLKASIAEGTYYYRCELSGFLKITSAGTVNYTILHTSSQPTYTTT